MEGFHITIETAMRSLPGQKKWLSGTVVDLEVELEVSMLRESPG
jgi:hypothetical protein